MQLPFSRTEFYDVFGAYNSALWPGALALWFISVALVALAAGMTRPPSRALSALLAVHWAWSALAYQAAFFTDVNPMAWVFAVLFLIQATALFWYGVVQRRIQFSTGRSWRHIGGTILIVYAFVYPVINLAHGAVWARVPTFGVPCPTTILTIGLLLPAAMPSWRLAIIPVAWSMVGGSASFFFGVHADVEAILADQRYGAEGQPAPRVNAIWPVRVPFDIVPPQLLAALPRLPPELQYRIIGSSLVLWDHHSNLIVDILPGALTPNTVEGI